MVAPTATAARTASSTARPLITGRAPGRPSETVSTWLFGSRPKTVVAPENILVAVLSWQWTSRPMTGSKSVMGATVGAAGHEANAGGPLAAAVPVDDAAMP